MKDTKRVRTEKEECFDYHKEYFVTEQKRNARIITLIDEGCRIEKEEIESITERKYYYVFAIGVFVEV